MKNSLKKLVLVRSNNNNQKRGERDSNEANVVDLAQLHDLAKASQEMEDMRECYDSLLSAASSATNSAYEFSESLKEMGVCLLQKIPLNLNDHHHHQNEQTSKLMLMLGKVQFELQNFVDTYRSHIFHTITVPSESLINELQTVEEMKNQCDEKRELYEYMRTRHKEKGRSKLQHFSLQQLQAAKDEFDEEATLFVFRIKSLKQGQSRSLLTQAARHHSAQLSFFRKTLKALETLEPHVKSVTQLQHIDYHFSGLEDDESDDGEDDHYNEESDDTDTSSEEDDGELSFDGRLDDPSHHFVSASRKTMEENVRATYEDSYVREQKMLSQSAPLFPQRKIDPAERMKQLRPSSTRNFYSYVLPKPGDTRNLMPSENTVLQNKSNSNPGQAQNLYNSYPLHLDTVKYEKLVGSENLSGPIIMNRKSDFPPPLVERISTQQLKLNLDAKSSIKKAKVQSFSGPLTSRVPLSSANKPSLYNSNIRLASKEAPQYLSGPISSLTSTSPSPRISELHELPRPPTHLIYASGRPSGFVGFSAPLVSTSPETPITSKTKTSSVTVPKTASPLPTPSPKSMLVTRSAPLRPLEFPLSSSDKLEDIASPPLTPIKLANAPPT